MLALRTSLLVVAMAATATLATATERPLTPAALQIPPAAPLAVDDDTVRPARSGQPVPTDPRDGRTRDLRHLSPEERQLVRRAVASDETDIGGTDVEIYEDGMDGYALIDIDQDGRIFVAAGFDTEDLGEYVVVYRSVDGGTNFERWGQIGSPSDDKERLWDLDVAHGSVPRVFVTTLRLGVMNAQVAYADPTADTAAWTIVQPVDVTWCLEPQLEIDDQSFDAYYCYLVTSGLDGNGDDIWFTRSTDFGATWAAPYRIAELTTDGNLMYDLPRISYGFGGVLHVAFTYTERLQDTFDDAVRYMRAVNYGNSPTDWQPLVGLTSAGNGADDVASDVAASLDGPTVMLFHFPFWSPGSSRLIWSQDSGVTWPAASGVDAPSTLGEIEYRRTTGEFVAAFLESNTGVQLRASAATPGVWSSSQRFLDRASGLFRRPRLAFDPTRGDRSAWVVGSTAISFDAEWRSDPGIPNLDHGTPLPLDAAAASPPALADLDQDGDLEIVFGDTDDHIQAFHHDGTPVAGWPVLVPQLSATPIVVANLSFTTTSIIAGSDDGRVHAFDVDGTPRTGWPYQMPATGPTYVSVGALGGPYPRTVVAGTDNRIQFINYAGTEPLDTFGWILFGRSITSPAAIGDIDGDGISEAVFGTGDHVFGYELYSPDAQLAVVLPSDVSSMVSLADLDFDGRVEVIVPTASGDLYVLDGQTGDTFPGFPFSTPSGTPLTSAAVAQILGNAPPEIAVSARNWTTHVIYADGDEQGGYPVSPGDGWYAFASPIMGRVDGFSGDVVCASRSSDVWAFDNFGSLIDGWPQPVGDFNQLELTPAMGDIDLDGRNEIVAVAQDLIIIDVGSEPSLAANTWAMFGHDPQRTGCADCPEDLVTPVEPDEPGPAAAITRVSFAGAAPNPLAGPSTTFRFAVPARAAIQLEVYDLRGRRVRSLMRSEVPAGEHVTTWDGRDAAGRHVASGQYLARLQVRGPGLTQDLTRAVTVLR
jgi:hypothetical protein